MTGSWKPINATYTLHGEVLETVSCAKCLGVMSLVACLGQCSKLTVANLPLENPICHLLKMWVAKSYYLGILSYEIS